MCQPPQDESSRKYPPQTIRGAKATTTLVSEATELKLTGLFTGQVKNPGGRLGSGRVGVTLTRPTIFEKILTRPDPTRAISKTSWPDPTETVRFKQFSTRPD